MGNLEQKQQKPEQQSPNKSPIKARCDPNPPYTPTRCNPTFQQPFINKLNPPIVQNYPIQPQAIQYWRLNFQHPHLLKTLSAQYEGTSIRYFFEYCPLTLQQIVAERGQSNRYFPEEDLQALALGIISALSFLEEKGISHGNICSKEIYFDMNTLSFKILDCNLINGRASGIVLMMTNNQFSPLAPEFYCLKNEKNSLAMLNQIPLIQESNLFKNDIWSLGMVLLECAFLGRIEDIYQQNSIRHDLIQMKLQELQSMYSAKFLLQIQEMLQINFRNRPDAIQLFSNYIQSSQTLLDNQQPQYLMQSQSQPYPNTNPVSPYRKPAAGQPRTPNLSVSPNRQLPQPPVRQQQFVMQADKQIEQSVQQQQFRQGPPVMKVKQLVYPDGHVEYDYSQTSPIPSQSPSRVMENPLKIKTSQQNVYGSTIQSQQSKNLPEKVSKQQQQTQESSQSSSQLWKQQEMNGNKAQSNYAVLSNVQNHMQIGRQMEMAQKQGTGDAESIKASFKGHYNENQSPSFSMKNENFSNIQKLREEIEQSKILIQQYQMKSELSKMQQGKGSSQDQEEESIEDRIRKVIAQSKALRENFI